MIGSAYPKINNEKFFEWMRWAIDKVGTLPKKLRLPSEAIKVLCYDPPSPQREASGAYTNTIGVYTVGPVEKFPAPVVIYKDVKWGSPLQLAYSLAANGISAAYHLRLITVTHAIRAHENGKKTLPSDALRQYRLEAANLSNVLLKNDQGVVDAYRCGGMLFEFELRKQWETDKRRLDAFAKRLSAINCLK